MATKDQKYFKELGARLAAARNAQHMTQVELARALHIPQQTLAHYEVGRARVPIPLLITMSRILRFSLEEMLIGDQTTPARRAKRGPVSRLELQVDAITRLPKAKQRFVSDMLDTVLSQQRST